MSSRWVLYGYEKKENQFHINIPESVIVRKIFSLYINGSALKKIAEILTEQNVVYYEDKRHWNKNMVARIIENPHYVGDEEYPSIIDEETFKSAYSRKNNLGGKREKDTDEISFIKSVIICGTCGEKVYRYGRYNRREKWLCNNNCKTKEYFDDDLLFNKISKIMEIVISDPYILETADSFDDFEPDIECNRMVNDIKFMFEQQQIQFSRARKAVLDCVNKKFDLCPFSDALYTQPLLDYISRNEGIDLKFMSLIVKKIIINEDGYITIEFVNGKRIKERNIGYEHSSTNSDKDRS